VNFLLSLRLKAKASLYLSDVVVPDSVFCSSLNAGLSLPHCPTIRQVSFSTKVIGEDGHQHSIVICVSLSTLSIAVD